MLVGFIAYVLSFITGAMIFLFISDTVQIGGSNNTITVNGRTKHLK